MQIHQEIIDEITGQYAKTANPRGNRLIAGKIGNQKGEGYSLAYSARTVCLEAESPLAAAYGLSFADLALKAGHIFEHLGHNAPKISVRALWLHQHFKEWTQERLHSACKAAIAYGCNAMVFSDKSQLTPQQLGFLKKNQILSIVKLNTQMEKCPADPSFKEEARTAICRSSLQAFDYLMWESGIASPKFHNHPASQNFTIAELAAMEAGIIESLSPIPLIFYMPASDEDMAKRQASWILPFCQGLRPKTIVAFSSLAGQPCSDHEPPHPLWQTFRGYRMQKELPLMPIVNSGGVKQGEGLWPALTIDFAERFIRPAAASNFKGVCILAGDLPAKLGLLDCSLWTAFQTSWRDIPPRMLAETWFLARKPEWNFAKNEKLYFGLREAALQLSLFRSMPLQGSDECKARSESFAARLREFELAVAALDKETKKSEKATLSDYFTYFQRDAKRILLQFLQGSNMPLFNAFSGSEGGESFWTHASDGGRLSSKVVIADKPQRGSPGSRMDLIWKENRILDDLEHYNSE